MKRNAILSVLLALLFIAVPLFPAAYAKSSVSDFTVEWIGESPALTAVATWTHESGQYEMALTGFKNELSDDTLQTVAENFHLKKSVKLTDDALTDAEKFTHFIPHRAGVANTWVVIDDIRKSEFAWGDSLQCWAATASNMLVSTGWSLKAKDPATGAPFTGEDEVFSYFTKNYINDGDFPEEAIKMFFSGKKAAEEGEKDIPGLLPDDNPKQYMSTLSVEDSGAKSLKLLTGMASAIKKGAALGICVSPCSKNYPLLKEADRYAEKKGGRYVEVIFINLTEEEYMALPEFYWTFDENGGVVVLTKEGDTYRDKDGNVIPPMSVKKDHLYYDTEEGRYYLPEPEGAGTLFSVERHEERAESELDVEHPKISRSLGNGTHVITATGYIKELGKASEEDGGIRALFISDSDNDAEIWKITESTVKKEDRPNTYDLCYVEPKHALYVMTLDLTNYLEDGETLIARACLLYPKATEPDPPVPETGDDTPVGIYIAALIAAGTGLGLLRKKRNTGGGYRI